MGLSLKPRYRGIVRVIHFAEMGRDSLTFYLQMIAFYFAGPLSRNVKKFWISLRYMGDVQANKLTGTKQQSFSVKLPMRILEIVYSWLWEFQKLLNMRNIWGCPLLWEETKRLVLTISRKGFGRKFKGGMKSSYHRQEEKF